MTVKDVYLHFIDWKPFSEIDVLVMDKVECIDCLAARDLVRKYADREVDVFSVKYVVLEGDSNGIKKR